MLQLWQDLLEISPCLRPGGLKITQTALDFCQFKPASNLLDIGCGPGETVKFLRQWHTCYGIDKSEVFLNLNPGLVLQADLQHLPIKTAWADGIFYECVFSLVESPELGLHEAWRVLKPGGKLIISDLVLKKSELRQVGQSCSQGALDLATWLNLFRACNFTLCQQVDHTQALRELAAQLIWRASGQTCFCQARDLSYLLFIAEKSID